MCWFVSYIVASCRTLSKYWRFACIFIYNVYKNFRNLYVFHVGAGSTVPNKLYARLTYHDWCVRFTTGGQTPPLHPYYPYQSFYLYLKYLFYLLLLLVQIYYIALCHICCMFVSSINDVCSMYSIMLYLYSCSIDAKQSLSKWTGSVFIFTFSIPNKLAQISYRRLT